MTYKYDVFLSYPRNPDVVAWIDRYFLPRLHTALKEETLAACKKPMGKIFFDVSGTEESLRRSRGFVHGIEPGENWQEVLTEAMQASRCMVALLSNTYFYSHWCQVELKNFQVRQAKSKVTIVRPISLISRTKLPEDYPDKYQVPEIEDYVVDGPSFYESKLFPNFLREIRFLAETVAKSICAAPDFEEWQVTTAADVPQSRSVEVSGF